MQRGVVWLVGGANELRILGYDAQFSSAQNTSQATHRIGAGAKNPRAAHASAPACAAARRREGSAKEKRWAPRGPTAMLTSMRTRSRLSSDITR